MLSGPRALTSASEASDYLLHEYLVRNDKAHRTANRWHGGGAEALGLPERVSRRRFVALLEGHVPGTDIRLGRVVDGEHQHRPGWDCTFSAPKSVSLEALLHDNKAVMRAHDASVRAALDWIEAEFLQTRGYDPATGRRPRVKADGLVAATFRHVASRNNDPQLHTHAVIANMTRNAAGEWRSVEPTLLQRNRRLIGAWYRNDLARRLGEMGYVLVPTQVGGLPSFELAGYSPAMLEAFSTRRRDILDYMADKGWKYDAKTAQAATLHTRKRKDEPAPGELAAMWKARAEALGLARDADEVRLDRTERGFARPPARFTALEAVWQAVDHLEERHAVFGGSDLLAAALGREPGRHTHVDLQAEIGRLREDGHLVAAGDGALTTRRTLRAEKEVIRLMREGKGTARPLAPEEAVAGRLAATELTEGQKEAVRLILRSPDPVVGVQGFAGTGKTRMLNEVAKLAGGRQVFGLAPSSEAARVLGVEGGIGVTTLQWLLTRYGSIAEGTATEEEIARARQTFKDAVVVVDEASMVGTVQMRDLQRILAPLGVARLVLVGDSLQLRSVAAGQPFRLLQRAGMATARMDDVIRQRSVDLKAAVEHMVAGDPALAVESIAADVRELPADALAGTAARLWLSLPPDARKGTVILAPTHEMREEINAVVRRGLADEGVLGRRSVEIGRLVDRRLTRVHAADRESYRPGDVVVANRDVYGLREGEAWTVVGTGEDGVRLERRGETCAFAPSGNAARNLSLCESRPLPLRSGDEIVWTRNLRRRGLINGERATVERIARVRIDVRTHSGRSAPLRGRRRRSAPYRPRLELDGVPGAGADAGQRDRGAGLGEHDVGPGDALCGDEPRQGRVRAVDRRHRTAGIAAGAGGGDGLVGAGGGGPGAVARARHGGDGEARPVAGAGGVAGACPARGEGRRPALPSHGLRCADGAHGCAGGEGRAARRACRSSGRAQALRRRPGHGVEVDVLHAGDGGAARADAGGSGGGRDGGRVPSRSRRLVAAGGGGGGRERGAAGGRGSLRGSSRPYRGRAGAARRTARRARPRAGVRRECCVAAVGMAGAGTGRGRQVP